VHVHANLQDQDEHGSAASVARILKIYAYSTPEPHAHPKGLNEQAKVRSAAEASDLFANEGLDVIYLQAASVICYTSGPGPMYKRLKTGCHAARAKPSVQQVGT